MSIVKVFSNEVGKMIVTHFEKSDCYAVNGTGVNTRRFQREVEAVEYAQDQLLILTLENELAILAN
jgi:hypothetical protein